MGKFAFALLAAGSLAVSGCTTLDAELTSAGVTPLMGYGVSDNPTPYSRCLAGLAAMEVNAKRLPVFSVGEITDKTGQVNTDNNSHALSQGVSEMVISALHKSGKVTQVERLDLRIPLAEVKLSEQGMLSRSQDQYGKLPASDFMLVGALTELNYNIVSGGGALYIQGIGGGRRSVVVNVALDLRVIDARSFNILYVASLQKQVRGYEVEAGVFNFFGNTLVDLDAGAIRNEPLQLGVRSVAEMAVYQIMTEFLGLPKSEGCALAETERVASNRVNQPQSGEKS